MNVFFETKYILPKKDMLTYSSSDSYFPRTIKKNDLFIPEAKDLVLYSKYLEYENDPKLCKQLNSMFAREAGYILHSLRTNDLQFFRDVYNDLEENHFELYTSMYEYPFDYLTPKQLTELNKDFKASLKEWAGSREITKNDFEMGSFANPIQKEAVHKSKHIINKVNEFCKQR